jgi:uncharacterized protein
MTKEESERFRQQLKESMTFPSVYMFKFIIKSAHRNIALIESLFESETHILTKESENGKYISITAKQVVMDENEIIAIYQKAAEIKGIIFL